MRRLVVLLFALATFLVLPVLPATAQSERAVIEVSTVETPAGVAADGAILTSGTFALSVGGVVVETGIVEGRYYDRFTGVHGTRHFVNPTTGDTADTQLKVFVVDFDDTGVPIVVNYVFSENIVASSAGTGGHGRGVALLNAFPDGSFVLETNATYILSG